MCHLRKQNPAAVSGGSLAGQSAGTVRLSHTAWLTGMLFLLFAGLFWLGYLSGGFSRNTVSAGWENSSFHSADCGRVNFSFPVFFRNCARPQQPNALFFPETEAPKPPGCRTPELLPGSLHFSGMG